MKGGPALQPFWSGTFCGAQAEALQCRQHKAQERSKVQAQEGLIGWCIWRHQQTLQPAPGTSRLNVQNMSSGFPVRPVLQAQKMCDWWCV
eukprot:scaffold272355_cov15-Tisochrysis_lutea.AAC.1